MTLLIVIYCVLMYHSALNRLIPASMITKKVRAMCCRLNTVAAARARVFKSKITTKEQPDSKKPMRLNREMTPDRRPIARKKAKKKPSYPQRAVQERAPVPRIRRITSRNERNNIMNARFMATLWLKLLLILLVR